MEVWDCVFSRVQCVARAALAAAVRSAVWTDSAALWSSVSETRTAAPVHPDGGASTATRVSLTQEEFSLCRFHLISLILL